MRIKRDADPMVDFCGYLFSTAEPIGLHMGSISILREYGLNYLKRRTKSGIRANLDLTDDSSADWLSKCDELAAA
ncbi:hypothetical protein [Pectobacterium brasiliense]|uniref:hypothetical protein n=1 Tax=Pectobacterium brasiliense TaxID=180957 RepID=UPI003557BD17